MPASIGVNLRVTGNCRQGGRKYMEDCFSVAYQQTEDEKDLEYAFFGIYDGHGGVEAASFAKEHLMETIIKHKNFWSDNDEDVLRAIKDGYIATHYAMWREQSKWPKTSSGLPSTAGTTASVAFIRRGKIYIGHVGDSGIILGYQEPGSSEWKAKPLTKDHKPENPDEIKRIESCGGKVVAKSGVPRVVWNRPKIGHQGPVRRSTPIDEIPFLAVARSLGDLWSYNSQINEFVVSPDPDCSVLPIDTNLHRCLIFGTDGLFNMLSSAAAVHIVQQAERHNESEALSDDYNNKVWLNPSKLLVERALDRWHATKMRADNTSAVTLMLDPPGPPRVQVLKDRKKNLPQSGLRIMMTQHNENASAQNSTAGNSKTVPNDSASAAEDPSLTDLAAVVQEPVPQNKLAESENVDEKNKSTSCEASHSSNTSISSSHDVSSNNNYPLKERNFVPKVRESTSFDPREPYRPSDVGKENNTNEKSEDSIQIHEISSSNIEESLLEDDSSSDSAIAVSQKTGSKKVSQKRKLESEEGPYQQRKSLRLSLSQKFLEESKKPAPCTLAEEKLKKLAEEAEKSKSDDKNNNEGISRKLSITQKILRSKKMSLKKKSLVKSQVNKKKLKMVFETVMSKTGRKKMDNVVAKNQGKVVENVGKVVEKKDDNVKATKDKPEVKLSKSGDPVTKKVTKGKKIVVSARLSNFKRQSVRNSTQKPPLPKKPVVATSKPKPPESEIPLPTAAIKTSKMLGGAKEASNVKKDGKGDKNVITESSRKGKLQVLNSIRETRSSPGTTMESVRSTPSGRNRNDAKENIKGVSLKATVKKSSSKAKASKVQQAAAKNATTTTTLRQRIQDKTKTLKRSVLKKSR